MNGFTGLFVSVITYIWMLGAVAGNEVQPSKGIEEAVTLLAQSVSQLAQKVATLENTFSRKLETLENTITSEKASTDRVNQKLVQLSLLDGKLGKLDSKISRETSIIKDSLTSANRDIQLLATKIERIEHQEKLHSSSGKENRKRKAKYPILLQFSIQTTNSSQTVEYNITEMVILGVEKVLPRILASELSQFYANIAIKLDKALNQLHKDTLQRLRRVDEFSRKTLREVQDGRQDVSYLTNIQRNVFSNISVLLNMTNEMDHSNSSCLAEKAALDDFVKKVTSYQNTHFCHLCNWNSLAPNTSMNVQKSTNSITVVKEAPKGGVVNTQLSSPLWKEIFPKSHQAKKGSTPKRTEVAACADKTTATLMVEMKDFLRTLIAKGDDLRRVVTTQASQSVDLMKHLHQRFSLLMKKLNKTPNSEEALLAEVKELEYLVANSYSSILHAQNIFISSCNRIQDDEPAFERKIEEVLSKFLTSMELGHQFNQHHLTEMKNILEKLLQSKSSQKISFLSSNARTYLSSFFLHANMSSVFNSSLDLQNTIKQVESTEILLQGAIGKIQEAEKELQGVEWKSVKVKNQIDKFLTSAKDIKGLFKYQVSSLRNLQENINDMIDDFSLEDGILTEQISTIVKTDNSSTKINISIPKVCSVSLLSELKSHNLSSSSSITFEPKESETIKDKDSVDDGSFALASNFSDFAEYLQDEFDIYYHDYDYNYDDEDMSKTVTTIEV